MFKTFFITRTPEISEVDIELERTMQVIHDRMEKMLEAQNARRQRFASIDNTPSYYR
jgi:hypothetical protein